MNIEVSTDIRRLNVELIHEYISNRSYWGTGRTFEQVQESLRHSICFGAYSNGTFAGFGRVVSDRVAFSYILDMFVLEDFRGIGISRKIIEAMLSHPDLQTTNWLLGTEDAHGLYEKYRFEVVANPRRFMRRERACSH